MNFKEAMTVAMREFMPDVKDEMLDYLFKKHNSLSLLNQVSLRILAGHVTNQEAIEELRKQADHLIANGCLMEDL